VGRELRDPTARKHPITYFDTHFAGDTVVEA
jgi:hypothetical protein